jgi:hypothetical protein
MGGAVGALLGGGTGTVTIPALARMTELRRATIHGTVTIPNVVVAVVGAGAYTLGGHAVDLRVGVPMMVGGVAGVRWGAQAVKRASDELLRRIFIAVLLLAGAKLVTGAAGLDAGSGTGLLSAGARNDMAVVILLGIALGTVIGAWSAAMGLGGGLLTVPALALLFGVGLHVRGGHLAGGDAAEFAAQRPRPPTSGHRALPARRASGGGGGARRRARRAARLGTLRPDAGGDLRRVRAGDGRARAPAGR